MDAIRNESDVNLEDLKGELTRRLGLAAMVGGALLLTLTIGAWTVSGAFTRRTYPTFPFLAFGVFALLLVLGWVVRKLTGTHPHLARHLLVWGLTAGLLATMFLVTDPWLPFVGLLLIGSSGMLVVGGAFATAGVVAATAVWLTVSGARLYPLPGLLVSLAWGVVLAWLTERTLYTALGWAWTMQQRANQLLEQARDRQLRLNRTLRSLDEAYTAQRRTQRELIFARQQADEARRMKEQFAANVSHELRTPLSLILGFSEVMYLSPEVYGDQNWPPTWRRDVYQLYRNSRHLLDMIDDILALSRFEIVGFALNKEPSPLEPFLRETVEFAEDIFRDTPVRLDATLPDDLPALEIDRTRVRQVLLNLLNNARRFTKTGTVRLQARQTENEVIISVADTGPGIAADDLPYIFDEFYQVDRSLSRQHGGAGLGLAICKHFVAAHEGRIWVESQEGVGSTFAFALPIPGQYIPVSPLLVAEPAKSPESMSTLPVLVVDPDPEVVALIARHIDEHEVIQVEDVQRLDEKIRLHHPRAVVHNRLPGDVFTYNGAVSVPLIACSLPSRAWAVNSLQVKAYLNKPITAEQLLREIERVGEVQDVLVVDDERGFCELVERILSASGRAFDVRQTYSGEQGLEAMRARRPHLVLLDLIMPGVDGLQVLAEMREEPELADIPVVLVTATSYVEDLWTQRESQLLIHRQEGLSTAEILHCLRAVIDVLEPQYDERST